MLKMVEVLDIEKFEKVNENDDYTNVIEKFERQLKNFYGVENLEDVKLKRTSVENNRLSTKKVLKNEYEKQFCKKSFDYGKYTMEVLNLDKKINEKDLYFLPITNHKEDYREIEILISTVVEKISEFEKEVNFNRKTLDDLYYSMLINNSDDLDGINEIKEMRNELNFKIDKKRKIIESKMNVDYVNFKIYFLGYDEFGNKIYKVDITCEDMDSEDFTTKGKPIFNNNMVKNTYQRLLDIYISQNINE